MWPPLPRARRRHAGNTSDTATRSSRNWSPSNPWRKTPTDPVRHVWTACALAGVVLLYGCHKAAPDETTTETAVAVEVEPAKTGAVREVFAATGLVTAAPGGDLVIAAPDSARIAAMPKAEGDRVRAG